jgi:hypothetical protein
MNARDNNDRGAGGSAENSDMRFSYLSATQGTTIGPVRLAR